MMKRGLSGIFLVSAGLILSGCQASSNHLNEEADMPVIEPQNIDAPPPVKIKEESLEPKRQKRKQSLPMTPREWMYYARPKVA